MKNITRFTYEFTSFQGYRVSICRHQAHFTRYFSDKQYGGQEAAYQAAVATRERVMEMLKASPDNPARVFEQCRSEVQSTCYPRGLHPRKNVAVKRSE